MLKFWYCCPAWGWLSHMETPLAPAVCQSSWWGFAKTPGEEHSPSGRRPESGRTCLALVWPPPSTSIDVGLNPSRVREWQVHDDPNPTHEHCTNCSVLQSCFCENGGRKSNQACWRAKDGAPIPCSLLMPVGQGKLDTCRKMNWGYSPGTITADSATAFREDPTPLHG